MWALLFAHTQLIALSVSALLEAVNIPTLEHLTIRCRYAEPLDVFGCLMVFAENPAHAGVRTLTLSDATHLPTSLGRLRRNAELRMFLAQLTSLELSGRDVADVRESGAQRHLLRFLVAMTGTQILPHFSLVARYPREMCVHSDADGFQSAELADEQWTLDKFFIGRT